MPRYDEMTAEALLAALESAGRLPDLDLIRACVARPAELTPTLLEWLAEANDELFSSDDPRVYRSIHAGLLLIAYREEAALPIFDKILREDEYGDLMDWFTPNLAGYGPALLPWALPFMADEQAPEDARVMMVEIVATLAWHSPEVREPVLTALRGLFPPFDAEGEPVLPESCHGESEGLWTFAALELAQLHDRASRAQISALYAHDLLDLMVMGDVKDYEAILDSNEEPPYPRSLDIFSEYENLERMDQFEKGAGTLSFDEFPASELLPPLPDWPIPTLTPAASPSLDFEPGTYVRSGPKIGRNDPCPCGSGKKYKKCHGKNA
jgi:hypothetical protein